MFLVAGLGNPGEQYAATPHNLGFLVVDRLAARHAIRVTRKECNGLVGQGTIGGKPVLLVKPQTFMNLSGVALKPLLEKYELRPSDLILIYDELDLPWGELRVRPKGSAAGHNGAKDVIAKLGTQDFPRIRLGVHPGHPLSSQGKSGGADYLLSRFTRQQNETLDEFIDLAADAAESIIAEGVELSMTRFNGRAQSSKEE
jgi:PTH1 family peptidyl-tRNA hydrolase